MCWSTQAIFLSEKDFMQQYQTLLLRNFPQQLNNKTLTKQRCNAITNIELSWDTKNQISWFVYSGWIYISPTQSMIVYLLCKPYNKIIEDRFSKKLIGWIVKTKYNENIPWYSSKCDPSKSDSLNDCDMIQHISDITALVLNDLTNIRHWAARWYISKNTEDVGYFAAQHFTYAEGKDTNERIKNLNTVLCGTPQIPYFWPNKIEHCGFPKTYAELIQNSIKWQKILNNTIILDGNIILLNSCDQPNSGTNIIWCGVNNHINTQPYAAMINNELWTYNQYLTMYEMVARTNRNLIVWDQQWVSDNWYNILLTKLNNKIYHIQWAILHASNTSIQLLSDFESKHYIHIWLNAIKEISSETINNYSQIQFTNLQERLKNKQNTQKMANTSKW
jgi:hypothetical protein